MLIEIGEKMNTWIDMHTFIPYLFAFLFWGFQDSFKKISWKWYVGAIIFTVILALIFPLVGLKSYVNEIAIISESLMVVFSYKLMIKRLSAPLTFFLGLLGGLFWGVALFSLVGVIYNIN